MKILTLATLNHYFRATSAKSDVGIETPRFTQGALTPAFCWLFMCGFSTPEHGEIV